MSCYQHNFPIVSRPFAEIAEREGFSEVEVLETFRRADLAGEMVRLGPVIEPHQVGVSTLCAMEVPEHRLKEVAGFINGFDEVNHNYEREHRFNLWFVLIATDENHLDEVKKKIVDGVGLRILDLRLEESFFIDLGFPFEQADQTNESEAAQAVSVHEK